MRQELVHVEYHAVLEREWEGDDDGDDNSGAGSGFRGLVGQRIVVALDLLMVLLVNAVLQLLSWTMQLLRVTLHGIVHAVPPSTRTPPPPPLGPANNV